MKIPLVVTEQNPDKLGRTVSELDITGARLVDHKMKFSMMTPKVSDFFRENPHLKSVVLFGIEAHVCIYQTALDFLQRDYQVFLAVDGIGLQDPEEVPLAMEQLQQFGAVLSSSDGLIFQILGSADHPEFKLISNLIKTFSKL